MIQRIQSIYLLLATILLLLVVINPLCEFVLSGDVTYHYYYYGFKSMTAQLIGKITYPVAILLWLTIFMVFGNIFLYKNRKLQIRICVYLIVMMLGLSGLIFFYYKIGFKEVIANFDIKLISQKMLYTALFPLFSAFLTYLALKNILKDEALVKSMNRLR